MTNTHQATKPSENGTVVELHGQVVQVDLTISACQVKTHDGTCVTVDFTDKQRGEALAAISDHENKRIEIRGRGEFDADGVLTRIPRADLMYARQIRRPRDPNAPNLHDLMDYITELFSDIPEEELAKLPANLSESHCYSGYSKPCHCDRNGES